MSSAEFKPDYTGNGVSNLGYWFTALALMWSVDSSHFFESSAAADGLRSP